MSGYSYTRGGMPNALFFAVCCAAVVESNTTYELQVNVIITTAAAVCSDAVFVVAGMLVNMLTIYGHCSTFFCYIDGEIGNLRAHEGNNKIGEIPRNYRTVSIRGHTYHQIRKIDPRHPIAVLVLVRCLRE